MELKIFLAELVSSLARLDFVASLELRTEAFTVQGRVYLTQRGLAPILYFARASVEYSSGQRATRRAHQHMMQTRIAQLREKGLVTIEIIITENQRHLRVFLTQTKQQAFGGMHLTILFVLAIAVADFFHIEGEHSVQPHFDRRGRDHRVSKMEGVVELLIGH